MEILGFLATFAAGVVLGLIGGGGSLLVVPTLVYLFGHPPVDATAESLIVVGVGAAAGAVAHARHRPIALMRVAAFAIPSIAAAYAVRALVVPRFPEQFVGSMFTLRLDDLLMGGFALFAAAAGLAMLRTTCCQRGPHQRAAVVPVAGAGTGALTGLLGAGGGFAVLPALVLLVGLPMTDAVGASLVIVAAQALAGAAGTLSTAAHIDTAFVAAASATMLAGVAVGAHGSPHVRPLTLRRGFGWVILVVAAGIGVQLL